MKCSTVYIGTQLVVIPHIMMISRPLNSGGDAWRLDVEMTNGVVLPFTCNSKDSALGITQSLASTIDQFYSDEVEDCDDELVEIDVA